MFDSIDCYGFWRCVAFGQCLAGLQVVRGGGLTSMGSCCRCHLPHCWEILFRIRPEQLKE